MDLNINCTSKVPSQQHLDCLTKQLGIKLTQLTFPHHYPILSLLSFILATDSLTPCSPHPSTHGFCGDFFQSCQVLALITILSVSCSLQDSIHTPPCWARAGLPGLIHVFPSFVSKGSATGTCWSSKKLITDLLTHHTCSQLCVFALNPSLSFLSSTTTSGSDQIRTSHGGRHRLLCGDFLLPESPGFVASGRGMQRTPT